MLVHLKFVSDSHVLISRRIIRHTPAIGNPPNAQQHAGGIFLVFTNPTHSPLYVLWKRFLEELHSFWHSSTPIRDSRLPYFVTRAEPRFRGQLHVCRRKCARGTVPGKASKTRNVVVVEVLEHRGATPKRRGVRVYIMSTSRLPKQPTDRAA